MNVQTISRKIISLLNKLYPFVSFFKKLKEFPENLRCSNINDAMHKLLVGECLT